MVEMNDSCRPNISLLRFPRLPTFPLYLSLLSVLNHVSSPFPLYLSLPVCSSSFLPSLFARFRRCSPVLDSHSISASPPSPLLSLSGCVWFRCSRSRLARFLI
ncbi:uncharacterized protein LOC114263395 isoform X2 [Camellia sinensis]|uniref:uncharacterized protein LOC114263395 isoform X2 n=1 Tax=Camellia sinensis TaxID=4442 RepID=UPI0010368C85|nr:uncharacterized protein LOC114263395 isoform X2 [Camellia sinensis]